MKVLENNFKLKFKNKSLNFNNVSEGIKPFVITELIEEKKIVIVLNDNKLLDLFAKNLRALSPSKNILIFPSWDCFPYSDVSPSNQNINARFLTFSQNLVNKNVNVIITNYKNLIMLLPNKDEIKKNLFFLQKGMKYNLKNIVNNFSSRGYNHVDLVLEPSEYAVRGGILDIWPVGELSPYRLDFFDDTLESIKSFDPISQISDLEVGSITIYQSIEPPLSEGSKNDFIINYRNYFGPTSNKELFIHQLKSNNKIDGIEHWMPLFYKKKFISFFDFFNPELLVLDNNSLENIFNYIEEINDAYKEKVELCKNEKDTYNQPIDPELLYLKKKLLEHNINSKNKIFFNSFKSNNSFYYDIKSFDNMETQVKISSDHELHNIFRNIISKKFKKKIIFVTDNDKHKDKLLFYINKSVKNEDNVIRTDKYKLSECFDDLEIIDIIILPINYGFENDFVKVISYYEIFDLKINATNKNFKNNINLSSLNIQDYVVHNDHGIGKYLGLKAIQIDNMPHDCLVIEYFNSSKLYLPVENINLISKHSSSDKTIILDKLGQNNWKIKKNSVKKKIRDLANSLISLAAKRDMIKSFNMSIDYKKLQHFVRGFNFIETEDQSSCLDEVYNDLTSNRPMDRLVCGDVGFGKTEIALRAAFIASINNFKCLIIVPTTLLANQHYKNFRHRFLSYTEVELISRNTIKSKKTNILNKFKTQKCNILIGTHALLSLDFKDVRLGLIVVDEEQHFGVQQKEKIKSIKENTNLLTLSATPIPRTLHMSLLGIRDLSLITTPPVNRQNIRTTVCKFEKGIIRKAIQNEKTRGGQIFLIVPRVSDIDKVTYKLKSIYPKLKYDIAHGKLRTNDIEKSMNNFYNGKTDLLISTSIVESGLDIPKANTIIIYKSDHFGLAQLHQLRGRIGRSAEKGFAYFTIEKEGITKNAERRLKALQAMDTIGAGINLANYDLDIRGAGNLLGEEQSGQIFQVGVELYQKLLKECIDDLKNNKKNIVSDAIINIKLPILIPEHYISDLSLRLSIYRKVGDLCYKEDFALFEDEMINRFGPIPYEFKNLIEIVKLKKLASFSKIIRIDANEENTLIYFDKEFNDYPENFINWVTNNKKYIKLIEAYKIKVINYKPIENKKLLLHVNEIVNTMRKVLNIKD